MIYKEDCTLPKEYIEQLTAGGMEAVPDMIRLLINAAMQIERAENIQAEPYQRKTDRRGHSNGYKPKTVRTRMGEITFDVPQVREGGFYPGALEKGLRSERALTMTLAEMYIQGVSTRKVAAITQRLCGTEVSASQVSRVPARNTRGIPPECRAEARPTRGYAYERPSPPLRPHNTEGMGAGGQLGCMFGCPARICSPEMPFIGKLVSVCDVSP